MRSSETRLRKGDCSSCAARPCRKVPSKTAFAGSIGEVGEDDGIFVGESFWTVRSIVQPDGNERESRSPQLRIL